MKLSLILPIYKDQKGLTKFISRMKEQTSKDFQVIFVVDTNREKVLQTIDSASKVIKYKIVFNSARSGRSSAIMDGAAEATGTYTIIMSTSDSFKKTFVEDSIKVIEKQKSDIIEFEARFKSPIKFDGKIRLSVPSETVIADKPEILAYSYFFDFNKFFKTSVLKKTLEVPERALSNSRYSNGISSKVFAVAKTYSNVRKNLVTSRAELSQSFNPLQGVREWENFLERLEESATLKNYTSEIEYAAYSYIAIFLFAMAGASKNKVLIKKLLAKHNKLMETRLANFFETNKYMLKNNSEAKFLHVKSSSQELIKLYKEFK